MDKDALRMFIGRIEQYDDDEKEIYLKELGNAVHAYVKTGIKNRQLDEMIEMEEKFRKRYEERFDVKKMTDFIVQDNHDRIKEIEMTHLHEFEEESSQEGAEKTYIINAEKVSGVINGIITEVIQEKLQRMIKDAAYLSHINMLYELYEQEEQLRREEREYDKISEKYQKIADIAKELSEQKRVELEHLQEQVAISKNDLEELVSQNEKYFNVRNKRDTVQLSLSPSGRKYYEYVANFSEKYSKEMMIQAVYKNCDTLMEAIENSYVGGMERQLKLEEIPPDKERAIRFKYHRMLQRLQEENEETYIFKNYIIKEEKEREYIDNEKNRIRIPREWEYESD